MPTDREKGNKNLWETEHFFLPGVNERLYKHSDVEALLAQQREQVLNDLNIVWVCPPCAKKYFNKSYTEGKTNVYTAQHRECDACRMQAQCMHYRSYD